MASEYVHLKIALEFIKILEIYYNGYKYLLTFIMKIVKNLLITTKLLFPVRNECAFYLENKTRR